MTSPRAFPLMILDDVRVSYWLARGVMARRLEIKALDGVSLSLPVAGCVGLIGSSGSGKTTLANALCLDAPLAGGTITYHAPCGSVGSSQVITQLKGSARLDYLKRVRRIEPFSRFEAARTSKVADVLSAPLRSHAITTSPEETHAHVREMAKRCGLDPVQLDEPLSVLSAVDRHRVIITRAMMTRPHLLIADESLNALDHGVQEQIIALLAALRRDLDITVLLIAHDLRFIARACDALCVLRQGRVVEAGAASAVLADPQDTYTRALFEAGHVTSGARNTR